VNPEPETVDLPGRIPLFPLPNVVHLPHSLLPLHIFEPRYVQMVEDARRGDGVIGMVRLLPGWAETTEDAPPVARIGCAGRITDLAELPDHRFNLKLQGLGRFEILEEDHSRPYRVALIRPLPDLNEYARGKAANAALSRLLSILDSLARDRGEGAFHDTGLPPSVPFAAAVHNLALLARLDTEDLQGLLEVSDIYARVRRLERILTGRQEAQQRAEKWRGLLPDDPQSN
jgi:Lon protease-like protein